MFRLHSCVLSFCFFVWVLPLGFFISPSKQKLACDGQRAFCMCSHSAGHAALAEEGAGIAQNTGVNKEASASGGAHSFLAAYAPVEDLSRNSKSFELALLCPSAAIARAIDHVPKA